MACQTSCSQCNDANSVLACPNYFAPRRNLAWREPLAVSSSPRSDDKAKSNELVPLEVHIWFDLCTKGNRLEDSHQRLPAVCLEPWLQGTLDQRLTPLVIPVLAQSHITSVGVVGVLYEALDLRECILPEEVDVHHQAVLSTCLGILLQWK